MSYNPDTSSLHTSTKTCDHHCAQSSAVDSTDSTNSTNSEPQAASAKVSDSKAEAWSTGYYSDLEEGHVPKSVYL